MPPPPSPTSSDKLDLLGHSDDEALSAMVAGIEDIYLGQYLDYLTYDGALEFTFECVVEHVAKVSQEHFGGPMSIQEVMQLNADEHSKWLKAAQDET